MGKAPSRQSVTAEAQFRARARLEPHTEQGIPQDAGLVRECGVGVDWWLGPRPRCPATAGPRGASFRLAALRALRRRSRAASRKLTPRSKAQLTPHGPQSHTCWSSCSMANDSVKRTLRDAWLPDRDTKLPDMVADEPLHAYPER